MILDVTIYGHPVLRTRGRKIAPIDNRVRRLAEDMIETMRHKNGVGLAAQQIGLPLQMFVLEILQNEQRPSEMWMGPKNKNSLELLSQESGPGESGFSNQPGSRADGNPVAFDHLMPMVVINPEIEPEGEIVTDQEGCLSFPAVFGDVPRPKYVYLKAQNLEGQPIEFRAEGLLARAIQHEFDHLQGVLFIDRMDLQTRRELEPELAPFKNSGVYASYKQIPSK